MDIAARPQAYEAPLDLCKKLEGVNKVVVAIHGIGSQTRSSTIRYVVRQFGDRCPVKLPLMPLGFFHIGPGVDSVVSRMPPNFDPDLARIGFVEIFWANIPRGVVDSKDTLEETKAWARTIVSQAESLYASKAQSGPKLWPKDFALAGGVVEEIVETIGVLENLCTLAEKAGLFTFDLAGLLRDYVDDVQVVTEFEQYRRDILLCFHKSMAHVAKVFRECGKPVPEIFIVAHSEGTVVSFLALLEAIAGLTIADPLAKPGQPTTVDTSWIANVRGYMTIGSPIDKHLLLWPRLWNHVNGKLGGKHETPIKWRNYYDYGDPIGFELDTAREFLQDEKCKAFEFEARHDFGFSRYPLPGKAHNDYWTDADVFGHFIDDVVNPPATPSPSPPQPPKTKPVSQAISLALPYLLVFLIHAGAMYALYKGVSSFYPDKPVLGEMIPQLLALGFFFMFVTIAARLPRLTKSSVSRLPTALWMLFLGSLSLLVLSDAATFVGRATAGALASLTDEVVRGRVAIGLIGLIVVVAGWAAPRKPGWGRKWILAVGVVLVGIVVFSNWSDAVELAKSNGTNEATAKATPVWPAVLGSLGFMYLWWLGILLFDLTFIWNKYIRQAAAIKALRRWAP